MRTLKLMLPNFLLLLSLTFFATCLQAQNSGKDKYCGLATSFLDSLEKNTHINFRGLSISSPLIFLDPDNLFKNCQPQRWRGYDVAIVNNGTLIDSVKSKDPYFVLKGRCQYFLISKYHVKKEHNLYFHQPCSNEISTAKIRKKRGKLYISKIEDGVL